MSGGRFTFELDKLDGYRENNRLEAKTAQGGLPRSVWETYSAFANTRGGVILLGAEELPDHSLRFVGVPDAQQVLDDFWNTVNNQQKVSLNILLDEDVETFDVDGVTIIAIRGTTSRMTSFSVSSGQLHGVRTANCTLRAQGF